MTDHFWLGVLVGQLWQIIVTLVCDYFARRSNR